MKISASEGRWLSNKEWIFVIVFVVGMAAQTITARYDLNAAQKEIDKKAELSIVCNLEKRTTLLEKNLQEIKTISHNQDMLILAINKDLEYITKTLIEIKNELIRLELVSATIDQSENPS